MMLMISSTMNNIAKWIRKNMDVDEIWLKDEEIWTIKRWPNRLEFNDGFFREGRGCLTASFGNPSILEIKIQEKEREGFQCVCSRMVSL